MKRIILLAVFASVFGSGCESDKKKDSRPSTLPSATEMFDKGKAPASGKGKPG